MKTIIIGALALALAAPATAQAVAPAVDPHAGHAQHQAAGQKGAEQHRDHSKHMAEMHKHCQEMMKHHGKDLGAKSGATTAPAAGAHSGHHGN